MPIPANNKAIGDAGHTDDHNSISDTLTSHEAHLSDTTSVHGVADTLDLLNGADNTPRAVWLPSGVFIAGAGAPTEGAVATRWSGWTMRNSNSDRINTTVNLPRGSVVDIDILWSPLVAATGDVVFRMYRGAKSVSDVPASVTEIGNVTVVAPTVQYELARTRIASSLDLEDDMLTLLMLDRLGSDASDTLVGDVAVIGLMITPADQRNSAITDDGTWCWFNEPRVLASQTAGNIYSSYVTGNGDVGVASLDVSSGTTAEFTLHSRLETLADDHDTPGLLRLADGTLMAFYCTHSITDDPIYFRKSTNPDDVSAWDAEQTITLTAGSQPCYPKPVLIGSRIYVFYRNLLDCDYIYSDDDGATWSATAKLIDYGVGWRGYVNLVQNGSRIDFITGDDNPNESSNVNLYHFYFDGTNLKKSDGTTINAIGTAITTAQMTKIYDYTTNGDAWGWDLQLDSNGRPRVVYATFPTATNHQYYYAYWNGSAWISNEITAGGDTVSDRGGEVNYSGGIALLSSNTDVVYLSRQVDGQWEIEKWQTSDDGGTWTSEAVTRRSRDKQIRPTTQEGHWEGAPEVFWMSGWYVSFHKFGTRIVYT